MRRLPEPDRKWVMEVLSGLRLLPERFKMELETMRVSNDIEKHPILGSLFKEVKRKSTEEGLARVKAAGQAEAKNDMLRAQLEAKPRHRDKWLPILLKSDTLEGVIGKRIASTAKN